jgi:hypothetical protein
MEDSLCFSQDTATCPYPKQIIPVQALPFYFSMIDFNIILHHSWEHQILLQTQTVFFSGNNETFVRGLPGYIPQISLEE